MSTRSTTHFVEGEYLDAIVYRHADGYPEGHGADLLKFFTEVADTVKDTRFYDGSYLAAKLVVWLAKQFARHYDSKKGKWVANGYLDFNSVGIVQEDPGDIQYRYVVDCSVMVNGRPRVTVFEAKGTELGEIADVLKATPA